MPTEEAKLSAKVFDPHSPAYRWRLWIKYYSSQKARRVRHVYWSRIGKVLGILAVVGWLTITAALWGWLRYSRGFEHARYVNLVFPWRWHRYSMGMSADYFAKGDAELKAGHANLAVTDWGAALNFDGGDLNTRHQVGIRQFQVGLRSEAVMTLKPGVAAAYRAGNLSYLQDFFSAALVSGDAESAATTGQSLLPAQPQTQKPSLLVAFQTAVANERLKKYAAAIQIVRTWHLWENPSGVALWARCDWALGKKVEAQNLIDECLAKNPRSDELYQVEEEWARSRKDPSAVRRYARLRSMANPQLPAVRLNELVAQKEVAVDAEFDREVAAYLKDFSGNVDALAGLAALAVNLGRPDTVAAIRQLAGTKGSAEMRRYLALCAVRANLMARHYSEARQQLDQLPHPPAPANRQAEATEAGLNALIQLGQSRKGADATFDLYLSQLAEVSPGEGLFLIRALQAMGRRPEAIKLQDKLLQIYPNQPEIRAAVAPIES